MTAHITSSDLVLNRLFNTITDIFDHGHKIKRTRLRGLEYSASIPASPYQLPFQQRSTDITASASHGSLASHPISEAIDSKPPPTCASNGDRLATVDKLPFHMVEMNRIARHRWFKPRFLILGVLLFFFPCTGANTNPAYLNNWQAKFIDATPPRTVAKRGPPSTGDDTIPLVVTNRCDSTIWPGLATQAGLGPGTGGFELKPGESKNLTVGSNWQGRVWGRTNCTVNGESCACQTGDCFAKLDCEFSVCLPALP